MSEFRPYGEVFKAKVKSFEVAISDTDEPLFVLNLSLIEQADDREDIMKGSYTVLDKPVDVEASVMVTDKALAKYDENDKGSLRTFMKAGGFKNFTPLEVLEGANIPDVAGRTVVVQCWNLPDDYVAPGVRDDGVEVPGDPLPEPKYSLMWAVSSGNRKVVDSDTRRRLAEALKKPVKAPAKVSPPPDEKVPF